MHRCPLTGARSPSDACDNSTDREDSYGATGAEDSTDPYEDEGA